MRAWYKAWYGTDVPVVSGCDEGWRHEPEGKRFRHDEGWHGRKYDRPRTLGNATQFDKEFIEQMIPHHQMAIMMARMTLQHSDHQEMRELGSSIIRSQSAEVEQMQEWYSAVGRYTGFGFFHDGYEPGLPVAYNPAITELASPDRFRNLKNIAVLPGYLHTRFLLRD